MLRSYRENDEVEGGYNPNGFYRFVLYSNSQTALRLHVYDSCAAQKCNAREVIHDHLGSLYSITLVGEVHHQIYGYCQDATPFYEYIYRGYDVDAEYVGQRKLKPTCFRKACGDLYVMDANTLHTGSFQTGELTATLIIFDNDQEPERVSKLRLFLNEDQHNQKLANPPISPTSVQEAKEILDKLLALM